MKKFLPLILLAPLVLSSCSLVSLSKDKGVTSGQPCETLSTYTENNGIEYICWESSEGNLYWRQNREVEVELERASREAELSARDLERNKQEYYDCIEQKTRKNLSNLNLTKDQENTLIAEFKAKAIENRWPDSGACKLRIGKLNP